MQHYCKEIYYKEDCYEYILRNFGIYQEKVVWLIENRPGISQNSSQWLELLSQK